MRPFFSPLAIITPAMFLVISLEAESVHNSADPWFLLRSLSAVLLLRNNDIMSKPARPHYYLGKLGPETGIQLGLSTCWQDLHTLSLIGTTASHAGTIGEKLSTLTCSGKKIACLKKKKKKRNNVIVKSGRRRFSHGKLGAGRNGAGLKLYADHVRFHSFHPYIERLPLQQIDSTISSLLS